MTRPIAAPRAPTPPRLRAREDRCAARAAPQERGRVGARPDLRGAIYQERFGPAPGRGLGGAEPGQARLHHQNPGYFRGRVRRQSAPPLCPVSRPPDARLRVEHLAYTGVADPLSLPPRRSPYREMIGDAVKRPIPHPEIGRHEKSLSKLKSASRRGATGATGGFGFISTDFSMRGYCRIGMICRLCTRFVG